LNPNNIPPLALCDKPDAGNGFAASGLFAVTFFGNYAAKTKREERMPLTALATLIADTTATKKTELPWLKLAVFGDVATEHGCVRNDANVIACTGVEADYDGGLVTLEDAVRRAERVGLCALLYTSPSHTSERPRWRVLCPCSNLVTPHERNPLMDKLNGIFDGIFAEESWCLSQGYYFGKVGANPVHNVRLTLGACIDLIQGVDVQDHVQGRARAPSRTGRAPRTAEYWRGLAEGVNLGEGRHPAIVSFAGKLFSLGYDQSTVLHYALAFNTQKVHPPKSEREVIGIVTRLARKGDVGR
jgi:hypothetical protein